MDIKCETCSTVYRIQDGLIPAGKKISYTCKRCRAVAEPERPAPAGSARTPSASPVAMSIRDRILVGVKDLPAMPAVLSEIQAQMAGADINTRKICGLVEADPAIATKVLRSANSAYYGQSGRVGTLTGAVNLIGLKGLLEVVAQVGAQRLLSGRLPGYGYEAEDLWKHSLAVACGSKLLALRKDPGISDTAYLVGLIHDVGRIVLDRLVLEMKSEITEYMESEQKTFVDAETKFFGLNHAKVAAEVCRKWKFPPIIAVAVGWHHAPSKSNQNLLAYLLHMADHLATMVGISYDNDDVLNQVEEGTMDFLGLKQSDLSDLVSNMTEAVNRASEL